MKMTFKPWYENKLARRVRRLRLGRKYKHQDSCHPSFNIERQDGNMTILWKKKTVAQLKSIVTLKNRFRGSCFTIATGPSLGEIALNDAEAYDHISLNCAIRQFSEDKLTPTHCLIVDRLIFENHWDCVEQSILSGAYCYFSAEGLSRICERAPELLLNDNIYLIEAIGRQFGVARPTTREFNQLYANDADVFLAPDDKKSRGTIGFSVDLEKGCFSGKTVATWAVQLAYYLGYQNNFIIGMDLGGTGKSHFYKNDGHRPPDFLVDYEPYIRRCFEQARRASEQFDFSIYNLSKQSTLPHEIIPKISYDEALKLAAHNKEQT